MNRTYRWTSLSALLVAAGCSAASCGAADDLFGGATDAGSPVPADARERYEAARCGTFERCGCGGLDACEDGAGPLFTEMLHELDGARFNADCFEQAIDSVSSLACDDAPPSCVLFEGAVRDGSLCSGYFWLGFRASDCETGLICTNGRCSTLFVGSDKQGLGEFCDPTAGVEPCQGGLYCQASDKTCAVELEDGATCTQARSCSILSFCQGRAVTGTGTCSPRLEVGEACDSGDDSAVCALVCDDAGNCHGAECVSGTCTPPPPVIAPACASPEAVQLPPG